MKHGYNFMGAKMTASQYNHWTKPFKEHQGLTKALLLLNKILTYLCYVLYPLLLILQFVTKNNLWIRSLLTAGVSFLVVSLFRGIYNSPRPYEALEISPLINKATKGKSFPSRHVFSVFVIAMCWFFYQPVVGILLLAAGLLMACVRVIGGVHYPIDVVVGAFAGIVSGILGFLVF